MNLWIFNHYAVTPDLPGGTRHFDLGRELVRRGHKVAIFATSFHYCLHRETRLQADEQWKIEDADGVKFVWLRTPPYQRNDWRRVWNMVVFMLRVWRLGRKLPKLMPEIDRPDVVIGSSVHLLAVLAAYWVAKYHRARFIMEVRDLWPQTIIDMRELSEHHPITKLLQALERFLYRKAKRIITLLPRAGEYITAQGVNPEKVVWIPNGVDLTRFQNSGSTGKGDEGFKVMYLGAHGRANALDVLIQAAKVIQDRGYKDIRFILVGDGPEKPRLIELAQKSGLKNVGFRDPVPKTEVPKALQEADALIFNLERAKVFKYGISSNKLFDYMASGKPILFAVEAANNPVEEAHCGLTVPPRDPQALAEAVIRLYKTPQEELGAMGRQGREYVEKYHDWAILADKFLKCLEEVCP